MVEHAHPSPDPRPNREYDVALFGATGFAGRLTAEYLARNAPTGCRWALAGRNEAKLSEVRDGLAAIDPALRELPVLSADAASAESLRALAESTRVLITTVGPYVLYGDALVAACAAAGTDYLDLTGEPEFVNTTYVRHDEAAAATGARIVHAAGFDSVPYDLGVYFTVAQLPEGIPLHVDGYVRTTGNLSGGTLYTTLTGFSRIRQNVTAARERRRAEPRDSKRTVRSAAGRPGRDPINGGWALPFPSLDPQVVGRSARALERYGPEFHYAHRLSVPHLYTAVGGTLGLAGVVVAAQIPPARKAMQRRMQPGDGPSVERRARSWFTATFVGTGGGERIVTRVSGGDPGYDETAKMLAESALCLAYDELPPTAGQVTTAVAMGDALIARLRAAGINFEVL